jgi:hypothetical protein
MLGEIRIAAEYMNASSKKEAERTLADSSTSYLLF